MIFSVDRTVPRIVNVKNVELYNYYYSNSDYRSCPESEPDDRNIASARESSGNTYMVDPDRRRWSGGSVGCLVIPRNNNTLLPAVFAIASMILFESKCARPNVIIFVFARQMIMYYNDVFIAHAHHASTSRVIVNYTRCVSREVNTPLVLTHRVTRLLWVRTDEILNYCK